MSPKKNTKSNKTAHVLNLLTSSKDVSDEEMGSEETSSTENTSQGVQQNTAPTPHLVPPIVEVAHSMDQALSETIRDALEEDLEKDAETSTSPVSSADLEIPAESAEVSASTQNEASEATSEPVESIPEQEQTDEADTTPTEEKPPVTSAAQSAPVAPEPNPIVTSDDEITYVNVMQALVEESADKYIKMFDLCPCPRCRVDVIALTLNNLPPKYVVMKKGDMIPMLTIYEGRYSASVTAQITQACTQVKAHPHHNP